MLQKSWPNHWEEILNANNAQAPMSLRINTKKITRGKYLGLLAKQNIAANIDKYSTSGITLDKPGDVSDLPGFNEGLFYVQDISSQLAVSLLELAPKQIILDACAAPGGKLTHILEAEDNLAQVVAVDIDNKRIGTIRENLDRLQLNEKVLLITGDARNPEKWWDKIQFDRILLDAPCSATGVIRRHPDIKVLRTKNDIISLQKHQLQILEALWPLLKANGILLYATCSIFPQENTDVVEDFLQQNKDAKEIVINEPWGVETKHGRQIITGENNMDGFYYAKLRKIEP
jgi:16S rRNA (cytosine967-C5)-methyltransferase